MANDTKTQVAEVGLKKLEFRVDELVDICDQLRDENQNLRVEHAKTAADKASLLEKNEQVRTRVEAMIGRLRSMEKS